MRRLRVRCVREVATGVVVYNINNEYMDKVMFKKISAISILFCLATFLANGQEIDKRLWGTWQLDSVGLTVNRVEQKYKLSTLLANKSLLPRNLFTTLSFDSGDLGVHTSETEFLPAEQVCFKGSYTTNAGKILITMRNDLKREFSYSIENDVLRIWYEEGPVQFALIYKLLAKLETS